MNDAKTPSSGGAGTAALEARISRIRTSLEAQQARLSRASSLTALIGGGLCVLMVAYFYYFYTQIQEVMTPRKIVDAAESVVMDSLPTARKELEKQINDSADKWAAELSTKIQQSMPSVRQQAEDVIVSKSGEALDQFQVLTAARFRNFLQENKSKLEDGFRSFKKQEEADRFVADLHDLVEKQLTSDMREQSDDMLHTLLDLNAKLEALKSGERLNHEQALEREILMIAKRLQVETQAEQPPTPGLPDAPASLTPRKKSARPPIEETAPAEETPAAEKKEAADEPKKDGSQ